MDDLKKQTIAQYVQPLKKVKVASPTDTLGSALSKTNSSHESVFVYQGKTFLGIVCAHDAFYRARLPHTAHCQAALVMPPHLVPSSHISQAAEGMLTHKAYVLPVFGKGKSVTGMITARSLLSGLSKNKKIMSQLLRAVHIKTPITLSIEESAKKAFEMMRKKHISRIVLTKAQGHLSGIISRNDIADALTVSTPRQRFGRRESGLKYTSYFDGEKVTRRDGPLQMFATKLVLTAKIDETLSQMLSKMLSKKMHSIVIVDSLTPVGFLSMHDFLDAVSKLKPEAYVPVVWEDKKKLIGEYSMLTLYTILNDFIEKLKHRRHLMSIEVHVEGAKNAAGKTKLYTMKLHAKLKEGKLFISEAVNFSPKTALQEGIRKMERQVYK